MQPIDQVEMDTHHREYPRHIAPVRSLQEYKEARHPYGQVQIVADKRRERDVLHTLPVGKMELLLMRSL